jgi:hypothetical protein
LPVWKDDSTALRKHPQASNNTEEVNEKNERRKLATEFFRHDLVTEFLASLETRSAATWA